MNKIKDRDARTKKRQKAKNKFDRNISLGLDIPDQHFCTLALNHSEGKVRLLDEGAIVTGSGKLDIYIEKGAIKKFVQGKNKKLTPTYLAGDLAKEYFENPDEPMNIDDKYEGTINIGHQDFATFPFIVGTWGQSDLSVVDNGDGRKGLDVELKLNEAHPLVQALRVQKIPVGVSVEMYLHIDEKGTEEIRSKVSAEDQFWGALAVDEIFIADFAIVGECGNVGSSGSVDLEGVIMNDTVKDTESMKENAMLEETAEENEMPEGVEDTVEETPTDAPTTEDAPTDAPTTEEEAEEDEGNDEADTDEAEEGEEGGDEEDALSVAEERINALETENAALKEQVESLKKSNKKKDNKIKEYAERDEAFKKKFKGLDVSLGVTKETKGKEKVTKLYATGDGIGE